VRESTVNSRQFEGREEFNGESAENAEYAEKSEEGARLGRRPLQRLGNSGGWG